MVLYRWKTGADGGQLLVAVLIYLFSMANPPHCCRAIGKVLLLSATGDRILDVLDKVPYAFTMFTSVRFLQVDETGSEKLMIGADFAYVATIGVSSAVLDVLGQKLTPLISATTMIQNEGEEPDVHTLTLDERQTLAAKGKRYYFVKKAYVDKGKVLRTPVTSNESYPVGTGVPLDWQ